MCVWVGVVGAVPCCHGCHGDAALAGIPEGYDWGYVAHDEKKKKNQKAHKMIQIIIEALLYSAVLVNCSRPV